MYTENVVNWENQNQVKVSAHVNEMVNSIPPTVCRIRLLQSVNYVFWMLG